MAIISISSGAALSAPVDQARNAIRQRHITSIAVIFVSRAGGVKAGNVGPRVSHFLAVVHVSISGFFTVLLFFELPIGHDEGSRECSSVMCRGRLGELQEYAAVGVPRLRRLCSVSSATFIRRLASTRRLSGRFYPLPQYPSAPLSAARWRGGACSRFSPAPLAERTA